MMFLAGLFGCAGTVAARQRDAGAAMAILSPLQGIIGLLALVWGFWALHELLSAGWLDLFSVVPIACCVLLILLGSLLV
ncbi:MAG TPA: hypothetical protein VJL84_11050, partial [Kiloniellales bacterium]|nr:hypothetical protein [Kiloniellales bacterium]